jgi:hypothetical protein
VTPDRNTAREHCPWLQDRWPCLDGKSQAPPTLPVSTVVVLVEPFHLLMRLDARAGGLYPSPHIGMGLFGTSLKTVNIVLRPKHNHHTALCLQIPVFRVVDDIAEANLREGSASAHVGFTSRKILTALSVFFASTLKPVRVLSWYLSAHIKWDRLFAQLDDDLM